MEYRTNGDFWEILFASSLIFVLLAIVLIALVIALVEYIITAFSLYKIAKRHGHSDPWMAWVPYASNYLFADLIGKEIRVGSMTIRNFPVWYVVYPFIITAISGVASIFSIIPFIGWIVGGLISFAVLGLSVVVQVYVTYLFFKKYATEKATVYTVLSAVVPLAQPIILFIIRDTATAREEPIPAPQS